MIVNNKVQSTVKPKPLVIDDYSVYENSNISEISTEDFNGYEYRQVIYSKDEYMEKQRSDIDYIAIMSGVMF